MLDILTVGSLFSGIGGLDLGFERAGFQVRWQVEIDPYCRRVLAKHWPDVARYEDVREVGAGNLERVDVIVGGFPCQDVSLAGKRAGLDGARSGLWFEFARVVGELRPAYAVVENTPGLISRGIDRVLGSLAAHGYDAEWQIVSAASVGAPHIRERVFIVAYPGCDGRQSDRGLGQLAGTASSREGREEERKRVWNASGGSGQTMAHSTHAFRGQDGIFSHRWLPRQFGGSGSDSGTGGDWWATEPAVGRVANGVPRRVDRLRGLGNAVVPQVAEYVARLVMHHATEGR